MSSNTEVIGMDEMNNPKRRKLSPMERQIKEYAKRARESYMAFYLQRTGKEYKPNPRAQNTDTWTKVARCAISIDVTPEDFIAAQFNYARSLILPTMITGQKAVSKAQQYKATVMLRAEDVGSVDGGPVYPELEGAEPTTDVAAVELRQKLDHARVNITKLKTTMNPGDSLIDRILECPWRSEPIGILLAIPDNDRLLHTYAVAARRVLDENPHLNEAMGKYFSSVLSSINRYARSNSRN